MSENNVLTVSASVKLLTQWESYSGNLVDVWVPSYTLSGNVTNVLLRYIKTYNSVSPKIHLL